MLNKLSKDLIPLMKPHKEIVDNAIKPGLTSVTWSSTNVRDCKLQILFKELQINKTK